MRKIHGLRTEPWGTALCSGWRLAKAEGEWGKVGGKSKRLHSKRMYLIFLPWFQEGRSDQLCQNLLKNYKF